jgi:hypothetical protein
LEPGILYTIGEYRAELKLQIEDDVFQLINSSVWGTNDNKYSHLDAAAHLPYLNNPHFFCLYKNQELCALVVFNARKVWNKDQQVQAYYVRYFLANEKYKGKGIVPRHAERVMEYIKTNAKGPLILYAAVEKKNRNSFRIVERQGFKSLSTLQMRGFSRFFPKLKITFEILTEEDKPQLIDQLNRQYAQYVMRHFMTHFQGEPYYIVKKEGEIVAGVQLQRSHWRIEKMGGKLGWFVMNLLPHIPLLNRIFNPKKFRFLAFEGFFYEKGNEKTLFYLMESLLAQENYNSGVIFLDQKSEMAGYMAKNSIDMGLLYQFTAQTDSHIMVYARGLSSEEITNLTTLPFYTCSYDYI